MTKSKPILLPTPSAKTILTHGEGRRHCRHCGMQHFAGLRRKNHQNLDLLEVRVTELIQDAFGQGAFGGTSPYVAAETFGLHFGVPNNQIVEIFHRLNLKGILGQGMNKPPHDSTRDYWGGHDSAWMATLYSVRVDTLQALADEENALNPRTLGHQQAPRRTFG